MATLFARGGKRGGTFYDVRTFYISQQEPLEKGDFMFE